LEIVIMTKTLSVAEAKARLSEVIRNVESHGGPVVIERRGRPVAVIDRYTGQLAARNGWFERLYGRLADVDDFSKIMTAVVRSRAKAGTRRVDLDRKR
jgi:antitoxin (DNA-binding transcriptional repressor) of toxin-antitoxin stability system